MFKLTDNQEKIIRNMSGVTANKIVQLLDDFENDWSDEIFDLFTYSLDDNAFDSIQNEMEREGLLF
jgi:hypothetical protein